MLTPRTHKECSKFKLYGARTRESASAHCLAIQYARTDIRNHSFAVRIVKGTEQLFA
jgi:hypothetical protein